MLHFTRVGVRVGRGEEGNNASKASQSQVSVEMGVVASKSSLWLVSLMESAWWGSGTVLGPVDRNGEAVRGRSTLVLLSHACVEVRTWSGVGKASSTFFLSEISFAICSYLGWALQRSFDLQGLVQALNRGLALGYGNIGCSPTGFQWARKRQTLYFSTFYPAFFFWLILFKHGCLEILFA